MDLESLNAQLSAIHGGWKWIIATDAAAGTNDLVGHLRDWGASDILVVAGSDGVGELPDVEIVSAETKPSGTMMGSFREFLRTIRNPGAAVQAAVDRFDPDGAARVIIPDFHSTETALGRKVYGTRSVAVEALEDKTSVDELWDAAGIERAEREVVPLHAAPAAAARLASDLGTVWAADNLHGWHGGGTYTRWVGVGEEESAMAWFGDRAERVRVMPFLDGIPCSIHGFVGTSGTAAFRPCEMVILRNRTDRSFFYGGVATYWDPPPADRDEMRDAATRVAAHLAAGHGYLGSFSIDGVMTAEGFRPTELNPRMSAGMGRVASAVPGLAIGAIIRAMREGDINVDAGELESIMLAAADADRAGGVYAVVQGSEVPPAAVSESPVGVVLANGRLRRVTGDQVALGEVEAGENQAGAFVRLIPAAGQIEPGPSLGPLAVALMEFVAGEWGLEVGDLEPAPELRR